MKIYNHLHLSHTKTIIILANKGISRYKIAQLTYISKGKIRGCLNMCEKITRKPNLREPWKMSFEEIHKHIEWYIKWYSTKRIQKRLHWKTPASASVYAI